MRLSAFVGKFSTEKGPNNLCGRIVENQLGFGKIPVRVDIMTMLAKKTDANSWEQFLGFMKDRSSMAEYTNWIKPIKLLSITDELVSLEVPNIFVQQYILDNYKQDLATFLPLKSEGEPAIDFVISTEKKKKTTVAKEKKKPTHTPNFNRNYLFDNFIEGPANQFVKSAAMGVAKRPGRSYNPLFIHGGVGLGKTHLLHGIGHEIIKHNKNAKVQCITTEGFINALVDALRNKSLDKMKRFYRSLDVLLVDDIQFLQARMNFEEELCNTFEALINQGKQIVITSDKPPGQLKLSERMVGRMEWGLVANIGMPDLETRVAILQHKAEERGLRLPQGVAFFIAEHIFTNVRQLEGALNRLTAYCRVMGLDITEEVAEKSLGEMFQYAPQKHINTDTILRAVATLFNVRESELRGKSRAKEIALPRQIAMYLAKELLSDPLIKIASSFGGKTHSTLLHAWKKVRGLVENDEKLARQIQMARRNIEA
ncbi:MAG: chromosomal replication initiator protein DnaA [Chlamydiales bacterium]